MRDLSNFKILDSDPVANPLGGVRNKPLGCRSCPLMVKSTGFVPDNNPREPRVALLREHPTKNATALQSPYDPELAPVFEAEYLKNTNLIYDHLLMANVMRCYPHGAGNPFAKKVKKKYRVLGDIVCRQYDRYHGESGVLTDGGIQQWGPNAFIVTYDYVDALKVVAYKVFIRRAFELAQHLSDNGHKPVVLMGERATRLVNDSIFRKADGKDSGFKQWIGHWWLGAWPDANPGIKTVEPKVRDVAKIEAEAKAKLGKFGGLKRI